MMAFLGITPRVAEALVDLVELGDQEGRGTGHGDLLSPRILGIERGNDHRAWT